MYFCELLEISPMETLKYPIGMQTFSNIRNGGYVYIDKTGYLNQLIESGSKYVFLSRPRRFGKSLFLSMVEEYYKGNRELFEGLDINKQFHEWHPRPVLHLDFSGCTTDNEESMVRFLNDFLTRYEEEYNIPVDVSNPIGLRFKEIIIQAHKQSGSPVVILIDEYDKPLLDAVDNPVLQNVFNKQLRSFYSNLKSQDSHIEFAMLTGVTKFGHLSIFSDLNNLLDISMLSKFSGICGITTDELHEYLDAGVANLAETLDIEREDAYELLKENYDGYHFSPRGSTDIYNPFSILNALYADDISNYWFQTGTPTFLVKLIKKRGISLQKLDNIEVDKNAVTSLSFDYHASLYPLLYQSGYLTIKGYRPEIKRLKLGFPNKEVEEGFYSQLMKIYLPAANSNTEFSIADFYDDIMEGNVESFMTRLQSLLSDFNQDGFNNIEIEQHYQDVVFIIMKLMGIYTQVEYKTASGRIDLLVKTPVFIYVFEFKRNKTAEEALNQINEKDYLLPFRADGRRVVKIGANFSDETHSLDSWIIEE